MTLDIPTLEHNVAQLQRDIDGFVQQRAQLQHQLVLLDGAREYATLALKRAQDTVLTVKAASTEISPTT